MNSFFSAATGHMRLLVAARIIYTPVCFVLVLLWFRHKMAYWLPFVKEISDFVKPVFM